MSSDNKVLQNLAAQVVKISDELMDKWAQLDYYNSNGTLRDDKMVTEVNIDDLSIADIVNRLLILPSFISKGNKKLLKMEDGVEKEQFKHLLFLKNLELEAIKNLRHEK